MIGTGGRTMNDRYLFRAKRIDDGERVEGYYACYPHGIGSEDRKDHVIRCVDGYIYFIDPTTLCQYTGLIDRNGQLIWENDICIIENRSFDEEDGYFMITWDDDDAMFELSGANIDAGFGFVRNFDCEVVGNIFDNPELLGNDDTGLER